MTTKQWRERDRKAVQRAIEAGQALSYCHCCGGDLPPHEVWDELRETGRGPDCDGSVTTEGSCRAFADLM